MASLTQLWNLISGRIDNARQAEMSNRFNELGAQLTQMRVALDTYGEKAMAQARTIDEILALATSINDRGDAVLAVVRGLRANIEEALKNERISAASQEKLNATFSQLEELSGELVEAVQANTPAEPSEPGTGEEPATGEPTDPNQPAV